MKSTMILSLCILILFTSSSNVNSGINILEAIKSKKVTVTSYGNEKSTHYHEPVLMSVKNNTYTEMDIAIAAGTLFEPNDVSEQTLISVQDIFAKLPPNQTKQFYIKAMCTEPSDRAGDGKSKYTIAKNQNDTMIKLANFISKNKYFSACGQSAVWTLVRRNSLSNVFGADSLEESKLRNFLSATAGLKILNPQELKEYRYNYYAPPPPKETLSGYFQFGMTSPHHIQVAMFDTSGILVRELFNQQNYMPKKAEKIAYQFDFSVYTHDIYYIKLIVDNEVIMNRTVNAKATRDKFKKQLMERY